MYDIDKFKDFSFINIIKQPKYLCYMYAGSSDKSVQYHFPPTSLLVNQFHPSVLQFRSKV